MTDQPAATWRNRIIRSGWVDPESLLAHPLNYRLHPQYQTDALAANLDELGQYKPIVVQHATGVVIDGHARVALAVRDGKREIWADFVDLDDAETNIALATGDPISALAEFDRAKYGELLTHTASAEAATMALLARIADAQGGVPPPASADAVVIEPEAFNAEDEWVGMPEFDQPDAMPERRLIVNFRSDADVAAFAALVGQSIGEKTRSLWYPEMPRQSHIGQGYVSDDA